MSKWSWIERLTLDEVRDHLTANSGRSDAVRLQLLDLAEERKRLEFHLNRLRREAGEIK